MFLLGCRPAAVAQTGSVLELEPASRDHEERILGGRMYVLRPLAPRLLHEPSVLVWQILCASTINSPRDVCICC